MAKKSNLNIPLLVSLSYLIIALICEFFFLPLFATNASGSLGFLMLIGFMFLVEFPMSLLVSISGLGGALPKDYYQTIALVGIFLNTIIYFIGFSIFIKKRETRK